MFTPTQSPSRSDAAASATRHGTSARALRLWELPVTLGPGDIASIPPDQAGRFDGVSLVDLPMSVALAGLHRQGWLLRCWIHRREGRLLPILVGFVSEVFSGLGRIVTDAATRDNLRKLAYIPRDHYTVVHIGAQMRTRRALRRRASAAVAAGADEFMVLSGGGVFQQVTKTLKNNRATAWFWRVALGPLVQTVGFTDATGVVQQFGDMIRCGELPENFPVGIVANPNLENTPRELASLKRKADALAKDRPGLENVRLYVQPPLFVLRRDVSAPHGWAIDPEEKKNCTDFYRHVYEHLLPKHVELVFGLPSFSSLYQVDFWSFLVGRIGDAPRQLFEAFHDAWNPDDRSAFVALRDGWMRAATGFTEALAREVGIERHGYIFQPATRTFTLRPIAAALDHLDRLDTARAAPPASAQ